MSSRKKKEFLILKYKRISRTNFYGTLIPGIGGTRGRSFLYRSSRMRPLVPTQSGKRSCSLTYSRILCLSFYNCWTYIWTLRNRIAANLFPSLLIGWAISSPKVVPLIIRKAIFLDGFYKRQWKSWVLDDYKITNYILAILISSKVITVFKRMDSRN